ncbi:MAG TPA: hypothetical protein VEM32_05945 [Geobacteraceae bacterium]|nr:hypothetical protein [Geobacteraceae bacterium]
MEVDLVNLDPLGDLQGRQGLRYLGGQLPPPQGAEIDRRTVMVDRQRFAVGQGNGGSVPFFREELMPMEQ